MADVGAGVMGHSGRGQAAAGVGQGGSGVSMTSKITLCFVRILNNTSHLKKKKISGR